MDRELLERIAGDSDAQVDWFGLDELEAAVSQRPDRLVVAGGDGSVAHVAAAAAAAQIPLAVIPGGTANDFARAHNLPLELDAACALALSDASLLACDLGWAGDQPFVNTASAGLAVRAAHRASRWKRVAGPSAYLVGALHAAAEVKPFACRIEGHSQVLYEGRAWQVIVAVSGAFGWGSSVESSPGDKRLDVHVLEAGSRLWFPVRAVGMRMGKVRAQPGVQHLRASPIEVHLEGHTEFNVDGDVTELAEPAPFRVEPSAFRLLVPTLSG